MRRSELLEIMLEQQKEIDRLQKELEKTKALLADKRIMKRRAGTIAEAALKLNEIFETAQRAADQYVYSVRKSYDRGLLTYDKEDASETTAEAVEEVSTQEPEEATSEGYEGASEYGEYAEEANEASEGEYEEDQEEYQNAFRLDE